MHIACAADSNYLPHAAAMLHSLLSHHSGQAPTIHFMHRQTLPSEQVARLGDFITASGGHWRSHSVGDDLLQDFPQNWRYSREAWYRTLLPELLPEVERVLYLDADTLIMGSLDTLWSTDLESNVIGAVANPLYPFMDTEFMRNLGLKPGRDYFNSGVLLMDLARWREQGLTQELHAFVATHGAAQQWPDQNALNAVLRGRWLSLPPRWNAQNVYFDLKPSQLPCTPEQTRQARKNPAIVHFVAPYKPWDYLCKHPNRKDYFKHLAATPWRNSVPITGATWSNRLLRLLPQPFMWLALRRLTQGARALRPARLRRS